VSPRPLESLGRSPVNRRQHAALARQLIAASGGLNEAVREQRLKRSRLAECQDPKSAAYMPADVINALELYCGEALYSRALADDRPTTTNVEDLADGACETAEEATGLQRLVRLLAKKGRLTPREQLEVLNDALKLRQSIDGLITAADGGGS
jgi:hypothetical protein